MVTVSDGGRCVFRVYLPHAGSVELVGSFCDWKNERAAGAIDLTQDDEGWWSAKATLPAGDHEFCYLIDARTWMPDYAASGMHRHPTGRWVSLLTVEAARAETRAETRPIGSLAEPRMGVDPDPIPLGASSMRHATAV